MAYGYISSIRSTLICYIAIPLITVPNLVKQSMNNRIISQILLCLFIGLVSVLSWPPRADTYRHAMMFYDIQSMSFGEAVDKYYRGGDFVLLVSDYIFGRLGFSFEFIRLIFMAASYYMALKIYNLICLSQNLSRTKRSYLFWMCLFTVPFYDIAYALRYGTAMTFVCFYIIKRYLTEFKNHKDYIYLFIGFIIHFGTAWLIGLILISPYIPSKINKAIYCIGFICALVFSINAVHIIQFLAHYIYDSKMILAYTAEEYSKRFIFHGFWGTVLEYVRNLPLYTFIIFALFILPYNRITKVFMLIVLMWAFTYDLWEINRRIGLPICVLGPIYSLLKYKWRNIVFSILIFSSLSTAIIIWRQYTVSNIMYIATPLPISIIQNYDYSWLTTNVTSEGTLKVQKH